jgi:Aspartyl protease/PDZ domain
MRTILSLAFVLLAGLLAVNAAPGQTPDFRAAEILARAKQAAGGAAWDSVRFIRMKMQVETSGLKGPAESLEDVRTGTYVDTFKLGTFAGASGYDGKTVWEQDSSGQVAIMGADDQRQGAANEAYRRARAFWFPDRAKANVAYGGEAADAGRKFHVIKISPEGGRPFDLWVDAETFMTARVAERNSRELRTTLTSDYRNVEGRMLPFAVRVTNGDVKYDTTVKVESVKFEDQAAQTAFAPPAPPKRDYGFVAGTSTTIPFRLVNNHIYLQVRLNGRPMELLFDTGGMNVITPTVARELGLPSEGKLQARGVGEKSVEASLTTVDRMDLGSAFLAKQRFVVIPMESFTEVEGVPITGIIGYEVFKRFVVVTDYENSRVTLIEPGAFTYRGNGTRVEMKLNDRIPEVAGTIDGVPGQFTLDTGARNSLTLTAPFIEKNNLVARYRPQVSAVTGWGVGGPARGWLVRAQTFTMGGVSADGPIVDLSQQKAGAFADRYVAGNVGAGILKKFNIVWDYSRNQLFFEKNKHHVVRDVHDRAGFWANASGDAFLVVDVTQGGPADQAGLKAGDRIMVVNGKRAVADVTLPDLRLLKKAPPSTNMILEVVRGTERRTINILLKDLV